MGKNLKAAREASGKTQTQVAAESGISERGYQKIEARTEYRATWTAIQIADAVGVTTYEEFKALWEQQSAPGGNPALDE